MTSGELARVRSLILEYGWNSTCYQILNPGIAHWISEDGDAVVGYVERGRVRVVAGAPVCAPERLEEIADAFERATAAEGASVCYFGAEARLELLRRRSSSHCLLYTSDAADDLLCVDLGGRRIIKKKKTH